jgi:hypothetical protein
MLFWKYVLLSMLDALLVLVLVLLHLLVLALSLLLLGSARCGEMLLDLVVGGGVDCGRLLPMGGGCGFFGTSRGGLGGVYG